MTCFIAAALKFGVPANIVLAIAEIEGGRPGLRVRNRNGSFDVGTMQFNTRYLEHLERQYGITLRMSLPRAATPTSSRPGGCESISSLTPATPGRGRRTTIPATQSRTASIAANSLRRPLSGPADSLNESLRTRSATKVPKRRDAAARAVTHSGRRTPAATTRTQNSHPSSSNSKTASQAAKRAGSARHHTARTTLDLSLAE